MIISHRYSFIFFAPARSAGTSLELALGRSCGEKDVLTKMPAFNPTIDHTEYVHEGRNKPPILERHSRPGLVRRIVSEKVWSSYMKIVSVRNPWDACVSQFFAALRPKMVPDTDPGEHFRARFKRWIRNKYEPLGGGFYFAKDGEGLCDRYIRYETLNDDYRKVCQDLGIPAMELPRTRSKTRPGGLEYQVMFDDRSREIVARQNRMIINHFDYQF